MQRWSALGLFLICGACLGDWPEGTKPFAHAVLTPKNGSQVAGTIDFAKGKNALLVRVYLDHVSRGRHGLHIHTVGDCGTDDASSAGEHFNITEEAHGDPLSAARHLGDLGNVRADRHRRVRQELTIPDPTSALFRGWESILGRAVIIHAKRDDLTSQPAGNSGVRIGCGIIQTDRLG
ncbi:MAG: superoxide dismutase family protein [Deltaproteobacteria bacterium]|nr:superoxide dismutase family protein [Deltaproteobacteria bacterium]MBI3295876.1 superoxide dismutase family protein [Deltaproteobacteria bacterium]